MKIIKSIDQLEKKLVIYNAEERIKIIEAARWSQEQHKGQERASGESYFIHPLNVANLLVNMGMDCESVVAGLLHDLLEDTGTQRAEIRKRFSKGIEVLVDGVTKISQLKSTNRDIREAETIRKMLLAMIKDIRVILIKLADKLHNMTTLGFLPPHKQKRIATECLDIYAPLAGRLGISWLKAELEDLALKHLNPNAYYQIKHYLAAKKTDRADYLKRMTRAILEAARKENIGIEVTTRVKHFYSIYKKMRKRNKDISGIFDLLGIRILTKSKNECYTILGLVHKLWVPIEGRFKDFIAIPKANNYQSLHTTVMGYNGKIIEIQIRTHQMHNTAEHGVAAHWIYKRGSRRKQVKPEELTLINKLKSFNSMGVPPDTFLSEIKGEILKDSIYVFTPKGNIIELPKGATAIDFAYHIHTEIGNHIMAAKADGNIIPLNKELKNTQVVEIITSNQRRPHMNWLRYVKTSSARAKIRQWLNKHDENLIVDRNIIAKKKPPGEPLTEEEKKPLSEEKQDLKPTIIKQILDRTKVTFNIGGEKNMMISLAQCCSPSTGDRIIGYISRGRGIIVHKQNCKNLSNIRGFQDRNIEVEWETVSPKATRRFKVTANITINLFSEIEGAIKKYKGHLIEGKLDEDKDEHLTGFFTVELDSKDDFKRMMKSIRTIPSILNIQAVS